MVWHKYWWPADKPLAKTGSASTCLLQPTCYLLPPATAYLLLHVPAPPPRRLYREACGSIEIPLPESKIHVAPAELDAVRPKIVVKRISQWESPSRSLVAEMMILAGEAVGRLGEGRGWEARGDPRVTRGY